MDKIWAIVLAAGASTRMGKQKLLLPFNGKSIVETVIQNIAAVLPENILVVLGSHREQIKKKVEILPVQVCINEKFTDGMLSSVVCGFQNLPAVAEAALIFLGDQPQIPPSVTEKVVQAWKKSGKGIVIPTFNNRRGHPVLIETKYKSDIEKLNPETGLRKLMLNNKDDVHEVECSIPEILRDIDTPEDYRFETKIEF